MPSGLDEAINPQNKMIQPEPVNTPATPVHDSQTTGKPAPEGTTEMTQESAPRYCWRNTRSRARPIEDVRRRVARGLAQAEKPEQRAHWEEAFFQAQETDSFLPT